MVGGVEEFVVVRCPSCGGLRGVHRRHASRNGGTCVDCKRGRVVRREDFYAFWLARFTADELREMAVAIWGPGGISNSVTPRISPMAPGPEMRMTEMAAPA